MGDQSRKSGATRLRKPTPDLVVLPREAIETYEPRGREICISISDPLAEPARLSPRFSDVLRLSFDDVTERGDPADILFAPEHAAAITAFIDRAPEHDRIVLHCNMGVSRSPAVALGLCDLNGWATVELERKHPGWNRLVRSVMRKSRPATTGRKA